MCRISPALVSTMQLSTGSVEQEKESFRGRPQAIDQWQLEDELQSL
ncbi:MAG: hypothetical protein ACI81L_000866 [Verrucomicrobiales bacterium]|jgi:hypothetical protein